jgi:isopenicillin-N epimerase
MQISRRGLLNVAPVLTGAAVAVGCVERASVSDRNRTADDEWERVRDEFSISPETIDFSALLIASHPRPVREAIEEYRRRLDNNPTIYLQDENERLQQRTLEHAANYLGVATEELALTDSTTAGLGLLYNGFQLQPGEEFLTSEHDYYATKEALRLAALRCGATVRTIRLYRDIHSVSADELVENLKTAIKPATRVAAVTWVHSSTGLKLPIRRMADALREINQERDRSERVLLCVDGVDGFGVEDVDMRGLGCDFLVAGCHKWLFGPRGTGLMCGTEDAWKYVLPTVPTFRDRSVRRAWLDSEEPDGRMTGATMTPAVLRRLSTCGRSPMYLSSIDAWAKPISRRALTC